MYIDGHHYIVKQALDRFGDTVPFSPKDIGRLMSGVEYPDLPCGEYTIADKGRVIMKRHSVCAFYKLLKILDDVNEFKEIFQSHRGLYAFLHSMTYDPNLKVGNIIEIILTHIAAYALLSIYDNNLSSPSPRPSPHVFWIGIILHIMTDSYSPAHTIRRADQPLIKPVTNQKDNFTTFKLHVQNKLFEVIQDPIRNKTDLKNVLKEKLPAEGQRYLKSSANVTNLYEAYKMFKFYHQATEQAEKLDLPIRPQKTRHTFDIVNFQYYNNQDGVYHKKLDFVTNVKKHPRMYERMLDEVHTVLVMYADACRELTLRPQQHRRIAATFVSNLMDYLVHHTFAVHEKDWNKVTGVVYSDAVTPSLWDLIKAM